MLPIAEHATLEQPVKVMNKKELIVKEISEVPEPLLDQVLDFIRFIKTKSVQDTLEVTMLSESSLQKDWLRPEEDEAWRDL